MESGEGSVLALGFLLHPSELIAYFYGHKPEEAIVSKGRRRVTVSTTVMGSIPTLGNEIFNFSFPRCDKA